ncbi:MAG TPA: DUF177 domain-containing protein [Ramlibacter sp.]
MSKQSSARHLDVKSFAEDGVVLTGEEPLRDHPRLLAETQGRGADAVVTWSASAEVRDPRHVAPQVWLHLKAAATLPLTCQRCLGPVEVPVAVDRSFRFVADEETAAAEDDESEEDVLALSRDFDLVQLVEDELLMEMPLAPRHETCPPVSVALQDETFEGSSARHENPFAVLSQLKPPKAQD